MDATTMERLAAAVGLLGRGLSYVFVSILRAVVKAPFSITSFRRHFRKSMP